MHKETQTKVVAIYACPVCNSVLQIEYLENRPYCTCGLKMELVAASVVSFYQAEKILKRAINLLNIKDISGEKEINKRTVVCRGNISAKKIYHVSAVELGVNISKRLIK